MTKEPQHLEAAVVVSGDSDSVESFVLVEENPELVDVTSSMDQPLEPSANDKSRYRRITVGASAIDRPLVDSIHFTHPIFLLRELETTPEIVDSIEEVSFNLSNTLEIDRDSDAAEVSNNSSTISEVQKAFNALQISLDERINATFVYDSDESKKRLARKAGLDRLEEAVICVAILPLLVKIQQLIVVDCDYESAHRLDWVILGNTHHLSNLRTLHVTTSDASKFVGRSIFNRLMCIPIGVLSAYHLQSSPSASESNLFISQSFGRESSAREVELAESKVTPEGLADIVRAMKSLGKVTLTLAAEFGTSTESESGHRAEFVERFLKTASRRMSDGSLFLAFGKNTDGRDCIKILELRHVSEADSMAILFPAEEVVQSWQIMSPEQRALRGLYCQLKMSDANTHGVWPYGHELKHPIEAISLIEKNPEVSQYIECINWSPEDHYYQDANADRQRVLGWTDGFHGTDDQKSTLESISNSIIHRMEALIAEDTDRDVWMQAIKRGEHSALMAILLTMVPNLRFLRLPHGGDTYHKWLSTVFRIARERPEDQILHKLERVHISHDDTEGSEGPEAVDELLYLPSLCSFDSWMFGEEYGRFPSPKAGLTSNLEEIELGNCPNSPYSMREFLKPLVNLQTLDMSCYECSWEYSRDDDMDEECASKEDYHELIQELCGSMLEERGLVWKVGTFNHTHKSCIVGSSWDGYEGLMIRPAERALELEQMNDDLEFS